MYYSLSKLDILYSLSTSTQDNTEYFETYTRDMTLDLYTVYLESTLGFNDI